MYVATMTLVLAFKCTYKNKEAILVSSDSKATTAFGIAYEVKKLHPIYLEGKSHRPVAIASGAGDTSLIKSGFKLADQVLLTRAAKEYPVSHDSFVKASQEIEAALVSKFSQLRNFGVDTSFQMILCGLDLSGKAAMYLFDSRGLAEPVHENPGYAIIGSGFVTGGILLLRLLGYEPDLELSSLGLLTTFVLDTVSEVDTAVGPFVGESYLMRIEDEKEPKRLVLGALKDEALIEYKRKVAERKDIVRLLWNYADAIGENNLKKLLEEALKKPRRHATTR